MVDQKYRPKVAIYARVSRGEKYQHPENQTRPLLEYAERMQWDIHKVLVEGISAVKIRPLLNEMLADAKRKKFDIILAWKLDRIARSLSHFATMSEELEKAKVRVVILMDNIDTDVSNASGRLQANMLMSFAQYEREMFSERIQAAVARRREKGLPVGGTPKKIVIDREKIKQLHEVGKSTREIAEILKASKSVIGRVVKEMGLKRESKTVPTSVIGDLGGFDAIDFA